MRVLDLVQVQVLVLVLVLASEPDLALAPEPDLALAPDWVPGQTLVALLGLLGAYPPGLGQYLGPTTSKLLCRQTFRSIGPQRRAHR